MQGNSTVRCVAALTLLSLVSCTAMERNPRAAKGTVIGALGGAAAGSAIGAIVGGGKGAGQGAAIGAVVGALGGGLVGSYMDRQAREMEMILAEQDHLRREQEKLHIVMASDVLFKSGKTYVQPGARDKLARLAGVLSRYPRTNVRITGHTDSRGSDEYNHDLSRRRAEAVADILTDNGVTPRRIAIRGEGESRPVATNETRAGRQQNRRVEIDVAPDEGLRAEQTTQGRGPYPGDEPH